ncbi:MAG: transketolase, partial [Anaerolineae bacterium]|nr:transketolase [Anaerolineae bacterium]
MSLHPDTWDLPTSTRLAPFLNWGKVLAELGEEYPEIVVLTADLKHANRLYDFGRVHPHRFFNFGIAEKNMVSAAAGLAAAGLLPYVATYASFVGLLCAEQIRT